MKFNSDGEEIVYKRLIRDCKDFIILHSLFLKRHITKISGEIDLLILVPGEGFFCIEVKHGGVERFDDGKWKYTGRNDIPTIKYESPFEQVNNAMHSLKHLIPDIFSNDNQRVNRFKKIMFGKCVFFTSLDEFNYYGTEAEKWEVFVKKHLNGIRNNIMNLSKNWHDKYSNTPSARWYNEKESRPTAKECELFKKALRGDFRYEYALINQITEVESRIEEFTEQQFDLLDHTYDNPHNLVIGGAGTGKTILALEIARRKVADGLKVGFFCYNNLLGQDLSIKAAKLTNKQLKQRGGFAGTMGAFMIETTGLSVTDENIDTDFWTDRLPFECAYAYLDRPESDRFDYLIIDEAQDLLSEQYLDVFDKVVKGGLREGNWMILGDFNNQAVHTDESPNDMLDRLYSRADRTRLRLNYNCRNPLVIKELNTCLTGCENLQSKDGMPMGDPVIKKFVLRLPDTVTEIEQIILKLSNKGIPYSRISLLSTKMNEDIFRNSVTVNAALKGGMTWETIRRYKGLENSYIIVFGFEEIKSNEAIKLLYVAVSRTKFQMYMILSKSLEKDYDELIQKNSKNLKS